MYARRAVQEMGALGYDVMHPHRASYLKRQIQALEGQGRWTEALAEFDRLDGVANNDKQLLSRVKWSFERGLAYLHTGRESAAATLFASVAAANAKTFGPSHFQVAQGAGLQAVALWRTGMPANRAKADARSSLSQSGATPPPLAAKRSCSAR